MSILAQAMGIPAELIVPMTNLIFVGIWFTLLPLTIQLRVKPMTRSKFLAFVIFWILMMTGYVLYEQGLIDHQFAEVLFAVFLLALPTGTRGSRGSRGSSVLLGVIFAALTLSHIILAGIALLTVAIYGITNRDSSRHSYGPILTCSAIFFGWYGYSVLGAQYFLQGITAVQNLLGVELSQNYLFHAATTVQSGGNLLTFVISLAAKGVIYAVVGAFVWVIVFKSYFSKFRKGIPWSVSTCSGIATLALLAAFASSPSSAYGFADRWLWIAPITLPVALLEEKEALKKLHVLFPVVKVVAVVAVAFTVLSIATTSTSFFWQPVAQQNSEAGFIAGHSGIYPINIGPSNPIEFYLYTDYHVDSITGSPFGVGSVTSFHSHFLTYMNQKTIITVTAYDLNQSPYAYTKAIPSTWGLFFSDGYTELYFNPRLIAAS